MFRFDVIYSYKKEPYGLYIEVPVTVVAPTIHDALRKCNEIIDDSLYGYIARIISIEELL